MTGQRTRGIALVAVLWIVTALSIAVLGLNRVLRDETRTTASWTARIKAATVADAAILQVLQILQANGKTSLARIETFPVQFGGQTVEVQVIPGNGLINLHLAPPSLLRDLFLHAGGMDAAAAQAVADAVLAWRNRPDARGQPAGIDAPEELLQIPGFTFDVYERIRPLVYCGTEVAGVNPQAAPAAVLAVLLGGQTERAASVIASRQSATPDFSAMPPAHLNNAASARLILAATVRGEEGVTISRLTTVQMATASRTLPWRVTQVRDYNANPL